MSVGFYLQQQVAFTVPVVMKRMKYGIKAPTLYPRDSEIKALKLTDEQVHDYNCTQRAHQNNVELMSVFLPLYLVAGAIPGKAMNVFYAGLAMFAARMLGGLGYSAGLRKYSGWFHIPEYYILWIVGKEAHRAITTTA